MVIEDSSTADGVVAEREKDVYIGIRKSSGPDISCQWFRIDGDPNNKVENSSFSSSAVSCSDNNDLLCTFGMPRESIICFGSVAWKSLIYVIGGLDMYCPPNNDGYFTIDYGKPPLAETFYIDTNRVSDGWRQGPDMLVQRGLEPHALSYKGKIWVMSRTPEPHPYAESLIPATGPASNFGIWTREPLNGVVNDGVDITGHAIYSDKLYFYGAGDCEDPDCYFLNCYDFKKQKWSVIEEDFREWRNPCASIDEIMYVVDGYKFMAYDLVNYCWYNVVGLKVDSMLPLSIYDDGTCFTGGVPSRLLRIGNSALCLLWIGYDVLHCTKFTVSKAYHSDSSKKCFIQANVQSYKIYRLTEGSQIVAALAVDTSLDNNQGEGDNMQKNKTQEMPRRAEEEDQEEEDE